MRVGVHISVVSFMYTLTFFAHKAQAPLKSQVLSGGWFLRGNYSVCVMDAGPWMSLAREVH